jgi:hypothetical protein
MPPAARVVVKPGLFRDKKAKPNCHKQLYLKLSH